MGSKTTWSRDMGKGLMAYAWRQQDRALLERHAAYCEAHPVGFAGAPACKMGEPTADGRTIYTPAMKGQLHQLIYALGGADHGDRIWPDVYSAGLVDYEANLQVMNIWMRGEAEEAIRLGRPGPSESSTKPVEDDAGGTGGPVKTAPADFALLDISDTMLARLNEHADREPECHFYQAVRAVYTGSYDAAVALLVASDKPVCSYLRCHQERACELADWLLAADIVLRRYGSPALRLAQEGVKP